MRLALAALGLACLTALAGCSSVPQGAPGTPGDAGASGPPPVADFTVTPDTGARGTVFRFDAAASQGQGLTYHWDFGDGTGAEGAQASHAYGAPGLDDATFGVTLQVRDTAGREGWKVKPAVLGKGSNAAPTPVLGLSSAWIGVGEQVNATAAGSAAADGSALTYRWGLQFHGSEAPAEVPRGHMHMAMGPSMDPREYTPENPGFDSPVLDPGATFDRVLTEPGLYLYHCHPHPWMTGAVLVQPGAAAMDARIAPWAAQWFLPLSATIAPGGAVHLVNNDAVWHTFSLSAHYPMQSIEEGGATHAFNLTQEGIYELSLVVEDAKGAMNATSQLVLVSHEAPPRTFQGSWNGTLDVAVPNATAVHNFTLPHPGDATLRFAWSSPVPSNPLAQVTLELRPAGNASGEALLTLRNGEEGMAMLPAGDYAAVVTATSAARVDYAIELRATLHPAPDFGAGGAMHMHEP